MAASDSPEPPGAAVAPLASGPAMANIPLPPLTAPPEPAGAPLRTSRRFGLVLTGVTLLFAFLVSSSAVRNSDFWLHLGAGRLLAHGEYHFGADPFTYTSTGAYWVNHAWLFDLGLYGTYQALGGLGLVVLKALAVTALGWLMLCVRRPDSGATLPVACTLLALLAISPRLLIQPAGVSVLFLGVCFYVLWRPHSGAQVERPNLRSYGPLLLLFALWANLDEWFFLGPVLAAAFWAGERLGSERRPTPGWLAPAGFAVCLLNPHLYHIFTVPLELVPGVWAGELHHDPRFKSWFLSAWQLGDYLDPSVGLSAGGLAYFALVVLGLLSFVLCGRRLVGWRLLIWVVFALLGAWCVAAIPFFAVVAGPITTLNLQDAAWGQAATMSANPRRLPFLRAAQAAVFASGLALAVLAWPGLLGAVPYDDHRVAWEVQGDASLQRVAETLHQWRQDGLFPESEQVFALHPEVTHYCAWFAPGVKGFLSDRSASFRRMAPEYETVCRALASPRSDVEDAGEWRDILRAHQVTVIVLNDPDDPDGKRLFPALHRLAPATDEWDLLRIDGRALVFGWKQGRPGGSFEQLHLNPARLAFGPLDRNSALPPAPVVGPQTPAHPLEWWEHFISVEAAPGWQSYAATMYIHYFDERAPVEQRQALARHAAGAVGVALSGTPVAAEQVLVRFVEVIPVQIREPDVLLLAVRAARLALAANPDDANAWLRLGQAYVRLHHATNERPSSGQSPLLGLLRHVQAVTALERALLLDPDLKEAHDDLSIMYGERTFLDIALDHRRHSLRLTRRGRLPSETQEAYATRRKEEEDAVGRLEQLVQDHKNEYAIKARPMSGDPLGRAQLALGLGLPALAVDEVLLQSPVQTFGGEGARLQLELLLQLGRADLVRTMLDDPEVQGNKEILEQSRVPAPARPDYLRFYRLPAYEWLRFLQSAATGDYDPAAESLKDMIRPSAEMSKRAIDQLRLGFPAAVGFELSLGADPQLLLPRLEMQRKRRELLQYLTDTSFMAAERADLYVLGGLLAAERGSPAGALQAFDAAFAEAAQRTPRGFFATAPLADYYRWQLRVYSPDKE